MSNVFDKVSEIARVRQEWEAKVNPTGEAWSMRKYSEKEMTESQKHIDAFQAAMIKACADGKFEAPEQAKAALDALDYDKQYMPLWQFAESCMPVQPETMIVAKLLSPSRVGTIQTIKDGTFGVYVCEAETEGVLIHRASNKVDSPNSVRGSVAREQQEAKQVDQSKAFNELSGAIGAAMKGAKPGKSLAQAQKELARLGGVKMVDGEKISVGATNKKGQMGLFGEDLAPTPAKPKAAPKARKAGK